MIKFVKTPVETRKPFVGLYNELTVKAVEDAVENGAQIPGYVKGYIPDLIMIEQALKFAWQNKHLYSRQQRDFHKGYVIAANNAGGYLFMRDSGEILHSTPGYKDTVLGSLSVPV